MMIHLKHYCDYAKCVIALNAQQWTLRDIDAT